MNSADSSQRPALIFILSVAVLALLAIPAMNAYEQMCARHEIAAAHQATMEKAQAAAREQAQFQAEMRPIWKAREEAAKAQAEADQQQRTTATNHIAELIMQQRQLVTAQLDHQPEDTPRQKIATAKAALIKAWPQYQAVFDRGNISELADLATAITEGRKFLSYFEPDPKP